MTAATAPQASAPAAAPTGPRKQGLTVKAPAGAHFELEEVNTARGTKSLGEVPILVYDDLAAARQTYGDQGIVNVLDGTSLRVSFQGIARRMCIAGKSDDEIATAEIAFRPGARVVGQATPGSRAARQARSAAEKVDGDTLASFLEQVASGKISEEDLKAFVS